MRVSVHNGILNFEVNGLPKDYQVDAAQIKRKAPEKFYSESHPTERREHHLVEEPSATLFFRICTAYPGSAYAEYATGQIAMLELNRDNLREYAERWISSMCVM